MRFNTSTLNRAVFGEILGETKILPDGLPLNKMAKKLRTVMFSLLGEKSIVPEILPGHLTSFTCDSGYSVLDHEGKQIDGLAHEAMFKGVMRVENRCVDAENLLQQTGAQRWYTESGATIIDYETVDLIASSRVMYLEGGADYTNKNVAVRAYVEYVSGALTDRIGVKIQGNGPDYSGSITTYVTMSDIVGGLVLGDNKANTADWSSGVRLRVEAHDSNAGTIRVKIKYAQIEDTTGNADPTLPGPYVSSGVLSSPYHGANVDGVKYFNFNRDHITVTDGVVDESGTKTYLTGGKLQGMPAATNLIAESNNLTAWDDNVSSGTLVSNVYADCYGVDDIDTLAGNSGASTGKTYLVSVANTTTYTLQADIVEVDSAAVTRVGLYNQTDPAWEAYVEIKWTSNVPNTNGSSGASNIQYTDLFGDGSLWRMSYQLTTSADAATDVLRVHIHPDRTGGTYAVGIGDICLHAGAFEILPIGTSGSTATRDAPEPVYSNPLPSGVNNGFWGYLEYEPDTSTNYDSTIFSLYTDANNSLDINVNSTGDIVLNKRISGSDNTATENTYTKAAGTAVKIAFSINTDNTIALCVDGGTVRTSANTDAMNLSSAELNINHQNSSTNHSYGGAGNVSISLGEKTNAELQALTS